MRRFARRLLLCATLLVVGACTNTVTPGGDSGLAPDAWIVDGKPFFPFGLYGVQYHELDDFKGTDINTVVMFTVFSDLNDRQRAPGETVEDVRNTALNNRTVAKQLGYLDKAHSLGIKVLEWWEMFNRQDMFISMYYHRDYDPEPQYAYRTEDYMNALYETHLQSFEAALPQMRNHPALLAYYGIDEPGGEPTRAQGKRIYNIGHELDPDHPIFNLFCGQVEYTDASDIQGVDAYWAPDHEGTPYVVARIVRNAFKYSKTPLKNSNLLVVPQYTLCTGVEQEPSPAQQRASTYLSIIFGAKGILYWSYVFKAKNPRLLDEIKKMATEVKYLTPVLLSPKQARVFSIRCVSPQVCDIPTMEKVYNGKRYLIAVNARPETATAQVAWPSVMAVKSVQEVFEHKTIQPGSSSFNATFSGYGTHVYEVDPATPAGPVPDDGLIGYWDFDEPDGKTAADGSGKGNFGVLEGVFDFTNDVVTGRFGRALHFDGLDNYVDADWGVDNEFVFGPEAKGMTMSLWLKLASWPSTTSYVGLAGRYHHSYLLSTDVIEKSFYFWKAKGTDEYEGVGGVCASFTYGAWNHLTLTFDKATKTSKLYCNGLLVHTKSDWVSSSLGDFNLSHRFQLGKPAIISGTTFTGDMDEVRLYNRALAPAEVQKLYTGSDL